MKEEDKSLVNKIESKVFELGKNVQDIGLSVQAALVTLNPITNALYAAIADWEARKNLRQLEVMIKTLSERLAVVESYREDYLQSDEYKALLFKTCHKVLSDLREDKARLFGEYLAGVTFEEDLSSSDSYMMLEVIDKIELEHLSLLSKMEPRTFDPTEKEDGWTGDDEDLKQLGVDADRFYLLSDYLSNLGLVTRLEKFNFDSDTGELVMWRAYYLSKFGKKLLDTLRPFATEN